MGGYEASRRVLHFVARCNTIAVMANLTKMNDRTLLTTQEAARYLGYSVHTIRKYIDRRLISASKFGPAVVIELSECDRFRREKRGVGRPSQK